MEGFSCFIFKGKKKTMICSNLEMNHLPLWFVLLSKFKHFEVSTSFLMVPMQRPFVASTLRKCQNQNGRQTDASIGARRLHRRHSCDVFMKIPFCLPDQKRTCQIPPPPPAPICHSVGFITWTRRRAPGRQSAVCIVMEKNPLQSAAPLPAGEAFFFSRAEHLFPDTSERLLRIYIIMRRLEFWSWVFPPL